METTLELHQMKPPEKSASKAVHSEYSEKDAYLQFELKRYKAYSTLIKMKIQQQLGQQVLEKVVKGAVLTSAKPTKPLTSLAIGEETNADDESGGKAEPVIKHVNRPPKRQR